MTPTLTIVEHVQIPDGFRLIVRVPATSAGIFSGIAGDAIDETATQIIELDDGEGGITEVGQQVPTGDALVTVEWSAEVAPASQLAETRALIEHALTVAATPAPGPEITPPGTEL